MGKQDIALPRGQSQYQVVGRFVPNQKYDEASPMCKVYRMNLFAKNKVVARSRFWYFLGRMCRVKKANGQIISVSQIYEKSPLRVKNFGIWFRYESRTGTHNAYKEYRELSLTAAVNALYQDMAGRSRAKSCAIQILKTADLKAKDCKRPIVTQMHSSKIKFPITHRIAKTPKEFKTTFKAAAPTTFC
jgi:large subunit ribosomal protein L18Ae